MKPIRNRNNKRYYDFINVLMIKVRTRILCPFTVTRFSADRWIRRSAEINSDLFHIDHLPRYRVIEENLQPVAHIASGPCTPALATSNHGFYSSYYYYMICEILCCLSSGPPSTGSARSNVTNFSWAQVPADAA